MKLFTNEIGSLKTGKNPKIDVWELNV